MNWILSLLGDIDRDEWKETIEFYLELKEEELEMKNQQEEQANFMKELRAKKLAQLGKGGATTTPPTPIKEVAAEIEEGVVVGGQGTLDISGYGSEVGMNIDG